MVEDTADELNAIADKLKPEGLPPAFTVIPASSAKSADTSVWDIFFARANKDVIMQCDLGHMGSAGVDPVPT